MRTRATLSAALLAVLAGGGAAYAGDLTPERPSTGDNTQCNPGQTTDDTIAGGLQVCPVAVDPVVNVPVVADLDLDALTDTALTGTAR